MDSKENSGLSAKLALVEWVRARDKKRYGKWITHNTAKGSVAEMLQVLDAAGYVLVPKAAIDWLNGEKPDAYGKWFGDDVPSNKPYWWRGRFRAMIAAATKDTP